MKATQRICLIGLSNSWNDIFFFFIFQLNEKFHAEDDPAIIYAISMAWFKDWENFVKAKTDSK